MSIRKTFEKLKALYPTAFGAAKIPLTKGVHNTLSKETDITKSEIRRALSVRVKTIGYLKALICNSHRINLDGTQAEAITEDEKKLAKKMLNKTKSEMLFAEAGWEFRDQTIRNDFPITFGKERVPLIQNITEELITAYPNACQRSIRAFLKDWKKTKAYKESIIKETHEYNLIGVKIRKIPEEQKIAATNWLNTLTQKGNDNEKITNRTS